MSALAMAFVSVLIETSCREELWEGIKATTSLNGAPVLR